MRIHPRLRQVKSRDAVCFELSIQPYFYLQEKVEETSVESRTHFFSRGESILLYINHNVGWGVGVIYQRVRSPGSFGTMTESDLDGKRVWEALTELNTT